MVQCTKDPSFLISNTLTGESHERKKNVLLCLQIQVFLNYRNYNLKLPVYVSYDLLGLVQDAVLPISYYEQTVRALQIFLVL